MKRDKTTPTGEIVNDPALAKYVERAAENAGGASWVPKKAGDWIGGRIEGLKPVKGKWGDQILITIRTKGGLVSHYANSVLQNVLDKINAKIGQTIVITYLGPRPSKKGRPYKLYGAVICK